MYFRTEIFELDELMNSDIARGFASDSFTDFAGPSDMVNRMSQVGKKMGLSKEAISELPNLFEDITNVCTPIEITDLLEGTSTPEVNGVVLNIVKGTCSSLSRNINDDSDVVGLIKTIGDFVNPSVKEKLKNFSFGPPLSEVVLPCPDDTGLGNSDKQIRDTLEKLNAPPKEVQRAVTDARKRRDSIKNFFTKNPISSQMPGGRNGLAGLPSPYENENMNRLTELVAEGVFGTVEAVFMSEVAGFVPLLYNPTIRA